jgi:hypothetical protein
MQIIAFWCCKPVLVNDLHSAGETSKLLALLPSAIDGMKTDILTIMRAH